MSDPLLRAEQEVIIREYIKLDRERVAAKRAIGKMNDPHPLDAECVLIWERAVAAFGGGGFANSDASDALYVLRSDKPMPDPMPHPHMMVGATPHTAPQRVAAPEQYAAPHTAPQRVAAPEQYAAPQVAPQIAPPRAAPQAAPQRTTGVSKRMSDPRIPPAGTTIYHRKKGAALAEATVREDGIEYAGQLYKTPSAAGFAAATALGYEPKAIGGYAFWGLDSPAK